VPEETKPLAGFLRVGASGNICIGYTGVYNGSFDLAASNVQQRREALTGIATVSWLRQEHGVGVALITKNHPQPLAGVAADAALTDQPHHVVSVITADCAPLALWTNNGSVGAVHAGWKGLAAGIIERSIVAMRELSGQQEVFAWLGPCIGPGCYEFGEVELSSIADRYGSVVRSVTTAGKPALDMTAGVRAAVKAEGAEWAGSAETCTACDDRWFSWRARKSTGRQALFVWRELGRE
jgi:polyphenol oxidase